MLNAKERMCYVIKSSSMLVSDVAMLDCGKSLIFSAVACLHNPHLGLCLDPVDKK